MKSFKEKVYEVVRSIPKGTTMTYQQVAEACGSPKAYRAVGTILKANIDVSIPCHRVIQSSGKLGEYNKLQGTSKEALLVKEGAL